MSSTSAQDPPISQHPLVTGFEVKGLFGRFNHKVTLEPDAPFAIVIGPNGIGKTSFFELARAAVTFRVVDLLKANYEAFSVRFSDGATLTYSRTHQDDKEPVLVVRATTANGDTIASEVVVPSLDESLLSTIDKRVPLRRVERDLWWDDDTDEVIDLAEVIERFGSELLPDNFRLEEPLIHYIRSDAASLIETQRLTHNRPARRHPIGPRWDRPRNSRSAVELYSNELEKHLANRFASSGTLGQQLDRTFASRVLKRTPPTVDEDIVRKSYSEQLAFRERLVELGFADPAPEVELPSDTLKEPELRLMEEYLNDSREKLHVFSDVLDKIELMQELIREKFLYKRFSITRDGFSVKSDEPPFHSIPLSALSSGEQHELVLIHSLLFRVSEGSVVLIDEPELSLHVRWQRRFLADLRRIAKLANIRFLIATHSPQIIDEWWEFATELGGEWK